MKHIIGKKVLLFPFEAVELKDFVKLHREDKEGRMGKFCLKKMTQEEAEKYVVTLLLTKDIEIYSCYTKEGKATKKFGYVYFTNITDFSACIVGILDKFALKGLSKIMRKGKYSFTEDALVTITKHYFSLPNKERLEYKVFTDNLLSVKLAKKAGFKKEGILRNAFLNDGKFKNIAIYSRVKSLDIADDKKEEVQKWDLEEIQK